MQRFGYWRDPIFLTGCAAYAINRWVLKPHFQSNFLHSYFNDLWLIPCAVPPLLWLHRKLGLRLHDGVPSFWEIAGHFAFWSLLFEYLGPMFMAHTVGDPRDVVAYAFGAVAAGLWWHRALLLQMQPGARSNRRPPKPDLVDEA